MADALKMMVRVCERGRQGFSLVEAMLAVAVLRLTVGAILGMARATHGQAWEAEHQARAIRDPDAGARAGHDHFRGQIVVFIATALLLPMLTAAQAVAG